MKDKPKYGWTHTDVDWTSCPVYQLTNCENTGLPCNVTRKENKCPYSAPEKKEVKQETLDDLK